MLALRVVLALAGATGVVVVLLSAIRTVVVPRGEIVVLTRAVFRAVQLVFDVFARRANTYEQRDRLMARYAPTALMVLPVVWAVSVIGAFTLVYWATEQAGWRSALLLSGSSLTTLGFRSSDHTGTTLLAVVEALIGLGLVALLISFLPTIYGHFSRRETTVAKLMIRAEDRDGISRPVALLVRSHAVAGLDELDSLWREWEQWFVELSESHTSFPALVFFRSPVAHRSWVTGAGLALDSAAIYLSCVARPRRTPPALMIRSGFLALRDVADYLALPYDPDPAPTDPITVTREEFDEVFDALAAGGVPLVDDRDAAWRAYAGWRVNYDELITGLALLTMAPYQPWVSDRSRAMPRRPPLRGTRHHDIPSPPRNEA